LVAAGAHVLIFGRQEKELNDALESIREAGFGEARGLTADTAKPEDVKRVFDQAEAEFGGVDILVRNAALAAEGVQEMSPDAWRRVVDVNLSGYIAFCQEAVQRMKAKGRGQIVNVGSMSAKVREKGSSVYVATKAGIEGFTEALRKEVNELGIRVSLIEPGLVGTDMTASKVPPEEQPKKQEEGQMLKAEDIAECIYYTLIQPERCDVVLVQIRPHGQAI